MINKSYSRCWLPNVDSTSWKKKIIKTKIFKYIYIYNNYLIIKNEIIFFLKKDIKFTKILKKATLIFYINKNLNNEEYCIKYKYKKIFIYSKNKKGFLYGLYHLIKIIQLNNFNYKKNFLIKEKPSINLRMINHEDNLNGNIYKDNLSNSIFFFNNNIHFNIDRIKYYCRLLTSININSICINNSYVNLLSTYLISKYWLIQLNEIYTIFLEYNIKMFISVNYKSPIILGKLNTFNVLNKEVIKWWEKKIEEIYEFMPKLGGFIINTESKNNSPYYYNINFANGFKCIADSLKYFNGILILRCSLYKKYSWKNKKIDRSCDIYNYFYKLDNSFSNNIFLQIKNGPIGSQIREPVSPLLGKIKKTSQILELQINNKFVINKYKNICWFPLQWKNILNFKIDKSKKLKNIFLNNKKYGITGISNIGDDYNWTGNFLLQSNIFCYGRILWNVNINLNNLIKEWIQLSINNNSLVINNISKIMKNSFNVYENYTTPLGLGGMIDQTNYNPNIDYDEYKNNGLYHYSNRYSLGNNRTLNGTKFIKQYYKYNMLKFNNVKRCPKKLLLFFHNLPYNYILNKKKKITIIQYMYDIHFKSVIKIKKWIKLIKQIKNIINIKLFKHIYNLLSNQYLHSIIWKNNFNTYFFRKSGIKDKLNRKIFE